MGNAGGAIGGTGRRVPFHAVVETEQGREQHFVMGLIQMAVLMRTVFANTTLMIDIDVYLALE